MSIVLHQLLSSLGWEEMSTDVPSARPTTRLLLANPYSFWLFLIGGITFSITMGIVTSSIILGFLLLASTLPFVLLFLAAWSVLKAITHTIFHEL